MIQYIKEKLNTLERRINSISARTLKYKVYTALLTQSGTNAPVATVLQNTINITPIFTYSIVGEYKIEFPSLFPYTEGQNKIVCFYTTLSFGFSVRFGQIFPNTSEIVIYSCPSATYGPYTLGVPTDGLLNGIVEIRVYPA